MGVRRTLLGGVHLRGDALRPGQEPRGGGACAARSDPGPAGRLSGPGVRGDAAVLGRITGGQTILQVYQRTADKYYTNSPSGLTTLKISRLSIK